MRKFVIGILAASLALSATVTLAADKAVTKTVAAVYKEKDALKNKQVRVTGKVIKVNNNVNRRNFIHFEDGTGSGDQVKLIATSQQTAKVGDKITVTGNLSRNVDFGSGYYYDILIEQATIKPAK